MLGQQLLPQYCISAVPQIGSRQPHLARCDVLVAVSTDANFFKGLWLPLLSTTPTDSLPMRDRYGPR